MGAILSPLSFFAEENAVPRLLQTLRVTGPSITSLLNWSRVLQPQRIEGKARYLVSVSHLAGLPVVRSNTRVLEFSMLVSDLQALSGALASPRTL